MKKFFLMAILVAGSFISKAQQDILLTQYMFNNLLVNPGYAGSKDYMMATLLYRNQWVGWDNAPTTEVASLHGPIGLTNLGWGALISHDHEGVTDRTDVYANFAYHLTLNPKWKLGLGLRGGFGYVVHKLPEVFWDVADPIYANDKVNNFLPNLGAGAYLYYKEKYYVGLSAPEVLSYDPDRNLSFDINKDIYKQVRHYFMSAGAAVKLREDGELMMRPSVLVKYTKNAPVEGDFNLMFILNQRVWIGGTYRTGDAIAAVIELQLTKQLRLGYSYDFTTTDIKDYSDGSHEIMLGYDFGYDIQKMKTPRYF